MNGPELLQALKEEFARKRGDEDLSDAQLARELGIKPPALATYRKDELSPKQVARLVAMRGDAEHDCLAENAVKVIVEFMPLDPATTTRGSTVRILSAKQNRYYAGLKDKLDCSYGLYVFHDSRGRAIYAGKAVDQSLWKELNNAYNRGRGEVQSIKRVTHPTTRGTFSADSETARKITKEVVTLYDLAAYLSVYEVHRSLISTLEGLIIRAFANDLANVRMESI